MEKATGIQIKRDVELPQLDLGFNQSVHTNKGTGLAELFWGKAVLLRGESSEMKLEQREEVRGKTEMLSLRMHIREFLLFY